MLKSQALCLWVPYLMARPTHWPLLPHRLVGGCVHISKCASSAWMRWGWSPQLGLPVLMYHDCLWEYMVSTGQQLPQSTQTYSWMWQRKWGHTFFPKLFLPQPWKHWCFIGVSPFPQSFPAGSVPPKLGVGVRWSRGPDMSCFGLRSLNSGGMVFSESSNTKRKTWLWKGSWLASWSVKQHAKCWGNNDEEKITFALLYWCH